MNIRYSYLQNDLKAFLASCELPLTDERPALFMEDINFVFFVPLNKDKIKVKLKLNYARRNSTRTTAKSR